MVVGVFQHQAVKLILGVHDVGHLAVRRQDADTADSPVLCGARVQEPVDVHRLMSSVEAANSEMHYADFDLVPVIGRLGYRDLGQRFGVEFHDTVTTDLTVPGNRSEPSGSAALSNGNLPVTIRSRSTRPE